MKNALREYEIISTHKEFYLVNLLVLRVASAAAVFRRIMEDMLKDAEWFIVTTTALSSCERMSKGYVEPWSWPKRSDGKKCMNKENKCDFLKTELQYPRHTINKDGTKVSLKKVDALLKTRSTYRQGAVAITGVFYDKLLTDMSSLLHPLHSLLRWRRLDTGESHVSRHWTVPRSVRHVYHSSPITMLTCHCSFNVTRHRTA